jgi:hypothetical protein
VKTQGTEPLAALAPRRQCCQGLRALCFQMYSGPPGGILGAPETLLTKPEYVLTVASNRFSRKRLIMIPGGPCPRHT